MADNARLVTFNAQNVTPQDDALLYEKAVNENGIIFGAELTIGGTNKIHIDTGFGIICGRFFEIYDSDLTVTLASSGIQQGRVIARVDLANVDEPFVVLAQTGNLPPLVQEDDINIYNGVYEILLGTFTVDDLTVSNLIDRRTMILGSQKIITPGTALAFSGDTLNVQMLNAFTQTVAGQKALDAVAGKTLNDKITTIQGYFDTAIRTTNDGVSGGLKQIEYNATTLEAGGNYIMVNISLTSTDTLTNAFNNATGRKLWACHSFAPRSNEINAFYQFAFLIDPSIKAIAFRNKNWWNNTWSPWCVVTDQVTYTNAELNTTYVGGTNQYVGVYKNPFLKVCQVEFDVTFKGSYSSDNVAIIATGLPKPNKSSGGFVAMARGTAVYTPRVNIDQNGRLQPWYVGTVSGQWNGSLMYFYRD